MTDSPGKSGKGVQPPGEGAVRSPGRRRLLQAGASAAPVIMTVVSRPVLAVRCDSPSGFTSLNVSHPGPGECLGQSPTTVLEGLTNAQQNALFETVFPTQNAFGSAVVGKKVKYVVNHNSGVPWDLAQQIVAAYYNVGSGRIPASVLTQNTVKAIWYDYSKNGNFSPRAGATWTYVEIVAYLKTTIA